MLRYSDELIDEIKNSNDIVDVVSQYVRLKRTGSNYSGLCPFHSEKSPSFFVSPNKQIFHCFGCGVGGNVFHFISKIEGVNFRESVKILAEKANITLPSLDNNGNSKAEFLKSRVYEINKETAQFYHENLYKPSAKPAQEYVKKRKLDNNTLKKFLIGYSCKFDELYKYLKSKGFNDEEILASALVKKGKSGKFYDSFQNRLMFPIQDIRGKVIAFGGRVLDDSKPKYLNSPSTIVYNKGRHLYGLNNVNTNQNKKIIIVEGYMDAVSLHQRGIENAVASLGTALTEAQGRLLRRVADQIIIGYDQDGAGQAATMRGLEILDNLGCDIRILQIEGAKDPDEFVTKYGSGRFLKYVEEAISLVEFKVKIFKKELNLENTSDKIKFLNEIAKTLSKVTNNIEREVYLDKISSEYKISKDAIYSEIQKLQFKNNRTDSKILERKTPKYNLQKKVENNVDETTLRRENTIISLVVSGGINTYLKIKDEIKPDDFLSEINRTIIKTIYSKFEDGKKEIYDYTILFEDEEIINHITSIMAEDYGITEIEKGIEDILKTYKKDKLISKRNKIMKEMEETTDKEFLKELESELNTTIIELAKIK